MHKRILTGITAVMMLLAGCSEPEGYKKPEDGLDAAREFVRAVLDGNFSKAEMYVLEEEEGRL
jgi:PBP1b-binding outer membrane lipoprotein LpoB